MADHVLDDNETERKWFQQQSKNGRAAYRRAVMLLTGGLPWWAIGPRTRQTNMTEAEALDKHFSHPQTIALMDKMFGMGPANPDQ